MAAIPSNLTSLDFTEIRESIRSYLRTRDEFTDYDFDGALHHTYSTFYHITHTMRLSMLIWQ
ncbi:MAG: hypothetical protein CM15mV13_3410 [uncultured marine virus]|nr:MAG: hypothetical protein CM15mV13_3410 [uncultured marine virus]